MTSPLSTAAKSRNGARSLSRLECRWNNGVSQAATKNEIRINSQDLKVPTENGTRRERVEMHNANALKIGLFGANCSSARTATLVPERWLASWPDCLEMARIADEAGIDFLLPIGRWKGYGGDSDFHGTTLETVTWACGLLAATQRITVFGTVHAPLFHPLIAAKEMVTADHIGQGRFGLNIVAGWNEGEFEMFGVAAARARRALRICPGMDRRDQARLVRAGRIRFRRQILQARRRACQPGPYRRHAAGHHECRLVGRPARPSRCAIAMRSSPRPARCVWRSPAPQRTVERAQCSIAS